MSTSTTSLLSGLVQGYVGEKDRATKEEIMSRKETRDSMLQYLGHMVNSPDVPAEHKQWAMQQIPQLAQHDITKKFPKGLGDLSTLPAVSVKTPGAMQQQTLSGNQPQTALQPPVGPGGASAPAGASAASPGPSSDVGRASNGTVNALGQAPAALIPPSPPGAAGPPAPVAPAGPITSRGMQMPIPPQGITTQAPDTTEQIAPAGAIHILSNADKAKLANATEQQQLNILQQRFPGKSTEDLTYLMQHGEFPKDEFTLTPGEKRYKDGKVIAENTEAKPGAKSGYEFDATTGGVKDLAKGGAILTPEEVASHPDAKSVFQQGVAERDRREKETEAKEGRLADRQAASQARAFAYATTKAIENDAIKASRAAAPMVNVLDTSENYMKSGQFTPRQDLALIVRAVRAMNPGTVRLPQKELELEIKAGSYGDRFGRWYSTATTGTLPDDQRKDLMNVIREETTQTAKSAADNWKQAYGDTKPLPSHLQRFGGKQIEKPVGGYTPPSGAPTMVGPDGHTIVVDGGKWVDAKTGQPIGAKQ